jgi:hypothetical protein
MIIVKKKLIMYSLILLTVIGAGLFLGKRISATKIKYHDGSKNKFGVWLWYLHHTGKSSHKELSVDLAKMGVKRIYIKVANGTNLNKWPELRDSKVPKAYLKNKIQPWAWSYNYPGNEAKQAEALYEAIQSGYKGFVIDIEKEFDYRNGAAEKLFKAFHDVKMIALSQGIIDSSFQIYCTTWGNPLRHGTPVSTIDKYVDGFMPQTYVEVWGKMGMDNIQYWIHSGTREYLDLGATKPIHHIVSTEYNVINHKLINEFLMHAGTEASLWRIPGGGVPMKVWDEWKMINWDMDFAQKDFTINNQVTIMDTINKQFAINYNGSFYKVEIVDSTGFVTKVMPYAESNLYKAPDLCNEPYTVKIYHLSRITNHYLNFN